MILGLHHAAITVPDLEEALSFYCGVLGFEVVMEADLPPGLTAIADAMGIPDSEYRVRIISKGNSCLELFQFTTVAEGDAQRQANQPGITHIALASDQVEKDYQHLEANGVDFISSLTGDAPSRFAYGRDPFGNLIEILEQA